MKAISLQEIFDKIEAAKRKQLPYVVYRKPNENELTFWVQENANLYDAKNLNVSGFVFAPFDKTKISILFPVNKCLIYNANLNAVNIIDNKDANFINDSNQELNSKRQHIELVNKAISSIKNGDATKIVVSRKEILKSDNINEISVFKNMLKNYQNAFVYVWCHPKIGTWLGATPENLISLKKGVFKTMALAATQPYNGTMDVEWGTKEIVEQKLVTDFILKAITKHIENLIISKPYTVRAGNLLHIRTDISGCLIHGHNLKCLLEVLHPTPAVCGMPKKIATQFIEANENYDRSFYTGYLGELNINNTTNLMVNLRCLQKNESSISIYVGGGITAESIALNEWNETVSKSKTMKKVL